MKTNQCPEPETLVEYLRGKLPQFETDSCEAHLAECHPCVETIRGLNVDDTLTDLAKGAWPEPDELTQEISDSRYMDNLISQMREIGRPEDSIRLQSRSVVEDRAAEVQNLLSESNVETDLGRLAHYRILELLGAGSTGVVYRAIDEQLERPVALKILRPSLGPAARERFIAEARATAAIDHVNVVTIYQVGEDGPLAYISMQLQPGETLDERLARETSLSVEETKTLGSQIAAGLHAAHENGLIHRDIKPANIWLDTQQNEARILDFGLVRVTDEDPQQTCTGMIAGTPCFMSPEQSRGDSLDTRSDLFSLGCLLYQTLTGRLPFCSANALATLQSVQRDQPPTPNELDPSVPADFSDLVMSLLEKSPHRRPTSSREFRAALQSERKLWSFPVDRYAAKPISKSTTQTSSWWQHLATLAAILLVTFGGIMYGPQITRIVTNQGELVIESEVSDVKIEVLQNEERVRIVDLATEQSVDIVAGNYQIRPLNGDNSITLDRNELSLSRGNKVIVKATMSRGAANVSGDSLRVSDTERDNTNDLRMPRPRHSNGGEFSPEAIGAEWEREAEKIREIAVRSGNLKDGCESLARMRDRVRRAPVRVSNHDALISKINIFQLELSERVRMAQNETTTSDLNTETTSSETAATNESIPDENEFTTQSIGIAWDKEAQEIRKTAISTGKLLEGYKLLESLKFRIQRAPLRIDNFDALTTKVGVFKMELSERMRLAAKESQPDASSAGGGEAKPGEMNTLVATELEPNETSKDSVEFTSEDEQANSLEDEIAYLERKIENDDTNSELKRGQHGQIIELRAGAHRNAVGQLKYHQIKNNPQWESTRIALNQARLKLKFWEQRRGLTPSLPVFDGNTYGQWLHVVEHERDIEKLIPAIKGVNVLAEKYERPEMIDAVVRVFRRGSGFAEGKLADDYHDLQSRFLVELSADELRDLYVHEIQSGTVHSHSLLQYGWSLSSNRMHIGKKLKVHADEIVNSIAGQLGSTKKPDDRFNSRFLTYVVDALNVDLKDHQELVKSMEDICLSKSADDASRIGLTTLIFPYTNKKDELLANACDLMLTNDEDDTNSLFGVLNKLKPQQLATYAPQFQQYIKKNLLKPDHTFTVRSIIKLVVQFDYESGREFIIPIREHIETIDAIRAKQDGKLSNDLYQLVHDLRNAVKDIEEKQNEKP